MNPLKQYPFNLKLLKPPRKKRTSKLTIDFKDFPKYTYGLEGKLIGLIGEPVALAQKIVRPKVKEELSTSDAFGTKYTYHIQTGFTYINLQHRASPFFWKEQEEIFHTTIPTTTLQYIFCVDLWADLDGNLKSFSFALQVT